MKKFLMMAPLIGLFVTPYSGTASSLTGFPASSLPEQRWDFRVFLDDKEVGSHRVSLFNGLDNQYIQVKAEFDVKFLFITAFSYRHKAQEAWQNGCLADIATETNNNGEELFVKAAPADQGLKISRVEGETTLKGCVRSFAYWNPELLNASSLLNTQTGEYENVSLREFGQEAIEIEGIERPALRKRILLKKSHIDLWYSNQGDWLALKAPVSGGRTLSYYRKGLGS